MDWDEAIDFQYCSTGFEKCSYCDRLLKKGTYYCSSCGEKVVLPRKSQIVEASPFSSQESLATCRYTLHCQRTFKEMSTRIESYIDKFKKDTPPIEKSYSFDTSLRMLRKKIEIETRGVLLKYLTIWKKFEKTTIELQDYVNRTDAKKQIYERRIQELEEALGKVKSFREEERAGANLMQQFWEKEKQILREQFEAEHTAQQHELLKEVLQQAQIREKKHIAKLHEQKEAEIKAMESAIVQRNKEQFELMAATIAISCKTKLERQMLTSCDTLKEQHQVTLTQQKQIVTQLEQQLNQTQAELEEKNKTVNEMESRYVAFQSNAMSKENTLRQQYEKQLEKERKQNKDLRQQLEHMHSKHMDSFYDISSLRNATTES